MPRDAEHQPSEERMDAIVGELAAMLAQHKFDHTLLLGDATLTRLFSGDPELFERTRKENKAFRKLVGAWHGEIDPWLTVTRTKLQRMVRITAQYRRFPTDLQQGLSLKHHEVLLRVPDIGRRIELGREVIANGWSADELRAKIPWDEDIHRIMRRCRRLKIRGHTVFRELAARNETPEERKARLHDQWILIHAVILERALVTVSKRLEELRVRRGIPDEEWDP
jgi:hypothetical protein